MELIIQQIQTMTPALVLTLGLAIGLQHAFEPDHVSAVTTQLSQRKNKSRSLRQELTQGSFKSSFIGAMWGAGHTTTLVIMGLLVYILAINIPQNLFMGFEFLVGLMLVFLAFSTFYNKKLFKLKHLHTHSHSDGTIHTHIHDHGKDHKHTHKSYLIGCIHGLAGSGSLVVLTASTLGSFETIFSFILIFGLGSIIGMAAVSTLIGVPFAFTSKIGSANRILKFIAGTTSLLIGTNILYEIAIVNNLFGI